MKPILKKIYRLPTLLNKMISNDISDDDIDYAIREFNERDNKSLIIFDKDKKPKVLNVEVRELSRDELTISCNDEDTIKFLDRYPKASVVVVFIPTEYRTTVIFEIYYSPIDI